MKQILLLATGIFSVNTDPAAFNLSSQPLGTVIFSSENGKNQLFGLQSGTGAIDFANLTVTSSSTMTIIGGKGNFRGASGTLTASQFQPFSLDPGVALQGQVIVTGSFEAVPEPLSILGVGTAIGFGAVFKRQLKKR